MEFSDIFKIFEGISAKPRAKYISLLFFSLLSGVLLLINITSIIALLKSNSGSIVLISLSIAAPLTFLCMLMSRFFVFRLFYYLQQFVISFSYPNESKPKNQLPEKLKKQLEGLRAFIIMMTHVATGTNYKEYNAVVRILFKHIRAAIGDIFETICYAFFFMLTFFVVAVGHIFSLSFTTVYIVILISILFAGIFLSSSCKKISRSTYFVERLRALMQHIVATEHFKKRMASLLNEIEAKAKRDRQE